MSTVTYQSPFGKKITIEKPDCIGSFYIVYAPELDRRLLVNCIDATPDGKPKRMRIQKSMDHGGMVLMPGQYSIIEKNPQWED